MGDWDNVERHKWNCDYPLLLNSPEGFVTLLFVSYQKA